MQRWPGDTRPPLQAKAEGPPTRIGAHLAATLASVRRRLHIAVFAASELRSRHLSDKHTAVTLVRHHGASCCG